MKLLEFQIFVLEIVFFVHKEIIYFIILWFGAIICSELPNICDFFLEQNFFCLDCAGAWRARWRPVPSTPARGSAGCLRKWVSRSAPMVAVADWPKFRLQIKLGLHEEALGGVAICRQSFNLFSQKGQKVQLLIRLSLNCISSSCDIVCSCSPSLIIGWTLD